MGKVYGFTVEGSSILLSCCQYSPYTLTLKSGHRGPS